MEHLPTCDLAGLTLAEACDECEIRISERHEIADALRSELVDAAVLDDIGYIEGLEVALRLVTPPSS
jgi:hypothetical protein